MNLRNQTPLEQAESELQKRSVKHHQMRREMMNWDKKLSKLNDEMLYYVLNRASSTILHREKEQRI